MRNWFSVCNERSHTRTSKVVSTEHFMYSDNMSNAFSIILFHWRKGGWFLLRNYPLSADPINSQRRCESLANSRTCRCEKGHQDERHRNPNLNFKSVRKNHDAKLVI